MVFDLVAVEVVKKYEMETMNLSVDEMVDSITAQIDELDPRRRYMFIEWLCAHGSQMQCTVNIRASLNAWLDAMPTDNTFWEYRIITNEINWWRDQNERTIDRLLLDHLGRSK